MRGGGSPRKHLADHGGNRVDTLLYGLLPEDISPSREGDIRMGPSG
jgi:hypothetical protein